MAPRRASTNIPEAKGEQDKRGPTAKWDKNCDQQQGFHLGPGSILFNIFNSNQDGATECTLDQIANDTKLKGVADIPDGCAAIQGDLNRLEKWESRSLMKFN